MSGLPTETGASDHGSFWNQPDTEQYFDTPDDALEYIVAGDRLRDIIITDRRSLACFLTNPICSVQRPYTFRGFPMTHLYYVRHAQPDYSVHDDLTRPLTEKGMRDCALVTDFHGSH